MLASTKLALSYTIFALVATAANIGAQDFIVREYSGTFAVTVSVVVGTGIGLVVKYLLDKRYIFRFQARSASHDGQTFALYVAMGLLTTSIFWGLEFGFQHLFETKEMRYIGGILGLGVGYVIKYRLDKRYVFRVPA
ncbi:hypothetical protein WJ85_31910 [Burkholderia ubonensis]|uniref:GtrA family protein n=1 Tax=Burkholderia ubonensis TaxID=101571 RepID=UPI0007567A0C|nr:GtrA family protein [Burkholderia ubonensis]KVO37538.1 hypothetical protein WJ76_10970 [Burkholderia ubonensis]KVP28855.1 hypothetical protein WJ85_31910 [Burkholderia ubonensis]